MLVIHSVIFFRQRKIDGETDNKIESIHIGEVGSECLPMMFDACGIFFAFSLFYRRLGLAMNILLQSCAPPFPNAPDNFRYEYEIYKKGEGIELTMTTWFLVLTVFVMCGPKFTK